MSDNKSTGRSKLKIIAWIIGVLAAAGLITAVILGGYTPFYRAFLQAPEEAYYAKRVPGVTGIEYLARINDGLYRGANPVKHLDQLEKLGIRSIINLRYLKTHDYREQAEKEGFTYFWIPLYPGTPPTSAQIEEFFAIVNDPQNQPVYIHCTLGVDRTGVMAGIYRIEHDGWDNERAVAEMEYFGHNELWMDLENFLKQYQAGSYKNPDSGD